MSKRIALVLLISIAGYLSAKAQKDTLIYYMKSNGYSDTRAYEQLVQIKSNANFYRVILPKDTSVDKNLFVVNDYYNNGKPKMTGKSSSHEFNLHREGVYVEFFPNGERRSVKNYKDDKLIGEVTQYFSNGKLYMAGSYDKDNQLIVNECRDSTGKVLAQNGNGQRIIYDEDFKKVFAEGSISNGLKNGEWHGWPNDSTKYVCTYEIGVATKGTSYKNGKEYQFTKEEVEPVFKGGMDDFFKFIGHNVHYPKEAKRNNIQGKVFLSFVINRDGTLSEVKVIRGIGGGCDEESVRVLKMSPPWRPGIQFGIPVRVAYTLPLSFALRSE